MNSQPLTEAEIAELVHETVDGWTMPPVRLDAPTWRERVRSPRARRAAAVRGALSPLGRAATGAVALSVAAALIAVIITRPPGDPGRSAPPSDRSTPRASDVGRASPLPKLFANGELPSPTAFVIRTEPFAFATVDLADGTVGPSFVSNAMGSDVQVRADGTMVCLCVSETGSAGGSPTTASFRLDHLDASGQVARSDDLASFTGAPDPRDEARSPQDSLPNVRTAVGFSEGGRFGFVGWSYRDHPSWKSGLMVVDLRTGEIVSRRDFPDVTDGDEDSRTVVEAPRVVGGRGDDLVVGRSRAEITPADSSNPSYQLTVEAFRLGDPGGVLGQPAVVPNMAGCGDEVRFGGILPDGGTWLACTRGSSFQMRLRRIASDGESLPDTVVTGRAGIEGDTSALSRDGDTLYAWDPASATLTGIDTATGDTAKGIGQVAGVDPGPLAALGRWLAPVAAAKSFLESSVVLSPDGSRIYAIGVTGGLGHPETLGSTGVFAFDATSLEVVGVYPPTADFVSLAIDPAGRYLYAAGLPGFDEGGADRPSQGASITVFDTTDGSVRLIAGQLGDRVITFGPEPLR